MTVNNNISGSPIQVLMVIIFTLMSPFISAQTSDTIRFRVEEPVDTVETEIQAKDVDIMDYLPPLALLIDSALTHAPEMDYFDALVTSSEYDIVLEKKSWANDLGFTVGYSWSYGDQILDNSIALDTSKQERTSTYATVALTVPLSTWYGRNDRIRRAEAIRASQEAQFQQAERKVREMVIETYSRLLLLQEQLQVTAEARETAEFISQTAEDRFREGESSLEELGQATDLKAQYGNRYAELKTQFSNTYRALERIVGVPFSKFQTENYRR